MSAELRRNAWVRFAWGVVILAIGIIFFLDQRDRIDARELLEWWPVGVIFLGVAHLPERRWIAGLFWIAIGVLFLPQLGWSHSVFNTLLSVWPLTFSFAGLSLIGQALRPRGSGSVFDGTAIMAGNSLLVGSQELGGANLVAVMGGCNLDLRGTPPPSGDVVVNVLAFWGGIEIRVPEGWQVIDRVSPILGGFEDKTSRAVAGAPRLIVRGSAIMGGVEVKNVREKAA